MRKSIVPPRSSMLRPAWSLLLLLLLLACSLMRAAWAQGSDGAAPKVLRQAFPAAETGFDPAQVSDVYSRTVIAGIFEAPLEYAYLSNPARLRPNTAAAMPQVDDEQRSFTFTIRPGIFFADDPAFGGKPRELVAADYVYAIKRHYDPRWKSGNLFIFENAQLLGLAALRREAIDGGKPFDYERQVEGLQVLDRYRFRVRLAAPDPRFIHQFADASITGAVAREVVERWADRIGEHPVGTGPFRLAQWRRSARIVLDRNPGFRELRHDETPNPADARLVAIADQLRGRRLPMLDRVEISIIEEHQPRWLSFLEQQLDVLENVPPDFIGLALDGDQVAPHLARRGVQAQQYPRADIRMTYFQMSNPLVGGLEPAKVALRRAIALAFDGPRELASIMRGRGVLAQSPVPPQVEGFDPAFRSEMSRFDLAAAKALLDLYGWIDRDGDGWRDQPDGRPLELQMATQADQRSRALMELRKKCMDALGLRIVFSTAQWPENLKASRAGKLMMWTVGLSATVPDAEGFLVLGYGPSAGQLNHARFQLPEFDRLFEAQKRLPDGAERRALIHRMQQLFIAYMPYKVHLHNVWTDLWQPSVIGYHRNIFVRDYWKYVDIDRTAQPHQR